MNMLMPFAFCGQCVELVFDRLKNVLEDPSFLD
jgi:hypothetical protein